jgi:hypothetical protein
MISLPGLIAFLLILVIHSSNQVTADDDDDALEYYISLKQEWEDQLDREMYSESPIIKKSQLELNEKDRVQLLLGSFIILLAVYCYYLSLKI